MRIVYIDDNRVFSEPLVFFLQSKHTVFYCHDVHEPLNGWFELTDTVLERCKQEGLSDALIEKLLVHRDTLPSERFRSHEECQEFLLSATDEAAAKKVLSLAYCDPLSPAPDCICIDMMLPRSSRYSKRETDGSRRTGLPLLDNILQKVPLVPVVVITVRNEPEFHAEITQRCSNVKRILVKPVTPDQVLEAIQIACGGGSTS